MESCPGAEHLQSTTARTRLREKLHRLPEVFQDDVEAVLDMLNAADESLAQRTRERDNVDRDYRTLADTLTARVATAEMEIAHLRVVWKATDDHLSQAIDDRDALKDEVADQRAHLDETPENMKRMALVLQEADDPVYRWAELERYYPQARAALRAARPEGR